MDNGVEGEIDLFSLDIDGIDYWIWNAVSVIQPRVVLVEYQDIWGPERAVTVPYKPDFNRFDVHPDFYGASLPAFVKLGHAKGYRLVGVNRYGFNAFFVRKGIGEDVLPEIPVADCFSHPKVIQGMKKRLPAVENLAWQEV